MITGPRGRWVTVAIWLLLGVAGLLAHARIDDVTAAGQSSFLPARASSPPSSTPAASSPAPA